jgi:mono/diheme cytochrome c family protein
MQGRKTMQRSTKIASATLAALLVAGVAVRVAVLAQGPGQGQGGGGGQGGPPVDDSKTVARPVKVISRAYDKKALLSAPPLSEEAYKGRVVWLQRCAYCHDGVGQPSYKTMGPWLDSDLVRALGDDTTKTMISAGTPNMPSFKYDLNTEQLNDVVEFLKTVSPSQKPTDSQLSGKAPAADGND